MLQKFFCTFLSVVFFFQSFFINLPAAQAVSTLLSLPVANQMMALSAPLQPVMLKGLRYDPQKPFQFEFILQQGDNPVPLDQLRDKGMDLVRYFMAAMTMPEEDLWVNLSPYEKNRIIADGLGMTRLGSDMLVQDFVLKQLSSSLTFPDSKTGSKFWQEIYKKTEIQFGRTDIPVNTFNKVWIVPEYAEVFVRNNTVVITKGHLKVMMEQDYLAQKKHFREDKGKNLASDVMRQVIIPVLEKEVNMGANFAPLRQMFYAVVLAEWYKRNLKNSIITRFYADQHKVSGIDELSAKAKEKIYKQYLTAYKKGVYNFIREDAMPGSSEIIPRKYFSGGLGFVDVSMITRETKDTAGLTDQGEPKNLSYLMGVGFDPPKKGNARRSAFPDMALTGQAMLDQGRKFGIIKGSDDSLTKGEETPFLEDMQNRWQVPPDAPREMQELLEKLKYHNKLIWFRCINVDMPDGSKQWIFMYRVQHYGDATGGGVRIITEQDIGSSFASWSDLMRKGIQTCIALAQGMTQKNTAVGLEPGGAKGGIILGPQESKKGRWFLPDYSKSDEAKKKFTTLRNIAAYWYGYWYTKDGWKGVDEDRLAPDKLTEDEQMVYMMEGRFAALMERAQELEQARNRIDAEKIFEWRDSYLNLIQEKNRIGFVPPAPGRYKSIYKVLMDIKRAHPQPSPCTKIQDAIYLRAYVKFANENPGLPMPELAAVAGKPVDLGGARGRKEATGRGLIHVFNDFLRLIGVKSHVGITMNVQGFGGNVATYTVVLAMEDNYTVTGISNLGATLYSAKGFTEKWLGTLLGFMSKKRTLLELWKNRRSFFASYKVKKLAQEAVLELPGYVLVPAATQNVITDSNVGKINVKVVLEGGNDVTKRSAEEALHNKGIFVLVDSVANAGGSIFSTNAEAQKWLLGRVFSEKESVDDMNAHLTHAMERFMYLLNKKNKGVAEQSKRVTLREVLMEYVVNRLYMRELIVRHHGQVNAIRLQHYPPGTIGNAVVKDIVALGLSDDLRNAQWQDLEGICKEIVALLVEKYPQTSQDELAHLVTRMFLLPANRRKNMLGDTIATARTLLNLLRGETLLAARDRLEGIGKNAVGMNRSLAYARQWRDRVVPAMIAADPSTGLLPVILGLQQEIANLNRVPGRAKDISRLSAPAPIPATGGPKDMSLTAKGGIDFDLSRTLINQQGEATFQSQIMPSSISEWRQIKGLRPIFLSLQRVNIPVLMGIK